MIFHKHMPGSSTKQKRMFKGDIVMEKIAEQARNKFKETEEKNPSLYQAKVDLAVKLKKSLFLEKAWSIELQTNTERVNKIDQQLKYEEKLKAEVSELDIQIKAKRQQITDLTTSNF